MGFRVHGICATIDFPGHTEAHARRTPEISLK